VVGGSAPLQEAHERELLAPVDRADLVLADRDLRVRRVLLAGRWV